MNFTTTPRAPATCRSTRRLCAARAVVHASSPSCAARSRRSDDVGEQHGRQHAVRRCSAAFAGEERFDLVEHAVGVAGEPHVVVAVELHQSRVRDPLGEILCVFATHVAVATPVQQQCRRLDALERGADVGAQDTGRSTALKYPGPPASRSPRAHQRRFAASPAQLGASMSTIPPCPDRVRSKPSSISRVPTRASRTADRGHVGSARTGSQSTSERTRCGWLAVSSMTGSADSDVAKTDAHSLPTASSTATSPSVQACIAGRSWIGTASELPVPRRSVKIRRLNDASRRRWPATVGSSHSRSIGNGRGGHEEKIGPVTDDLVREVVGVAILRVQRLRSARHAVSIARRRLTPRPQA